MTFNLSSIMTMIKARQHKYTHRKMIGRDPKTNRIRYRYYYAEHHGGGITSAKFEEGSAFKLTFKGRRGHFHVQRTEGDKVFVKHDGRPNAKEVEMTKSELRALLKAQHETIETKKREKAQEARRKGRKKPAKKKTQTTAPKKTMRSYIAEQDEKISNLRAQIERLEQEEKNNPRLDHFDEIYKIKEEIGTLGRVRSIAQEADSLNNPKSSLNALKDPRDRTKGIIPLEAYNEIIGILEDTVKTQAQTPREQLTETAQQGADNFEAMPDDNTRLGVLKSKLDQGQKLRMSEIGEVLSEVNKAQGRMGEAASQLYSIMNGEYNPAMLEGGGKLVTYQGERRDASENLERHFDFDTIHQESIEKQRQFIEAAQSNVNVLNKLREDIARKLTAPPEQRAQISSLKAQIARGEPLKKRDIAVVISEVDRAQAQMGEAAVILNTITNSASYNPAMLEGAGDRDKIERRDAGDRLIDQFDIAKIHKTADLQEQTRFLDAAQSNINLLNKLKVGIGKRLRGEDNFETMPESDTASSENVMEARYTSAEETVNYLENRPREVFQRIKEASAEDVPYLYYEARKKYVKENRTEAVDDMIRELASRMAGDGDGFLIKIINKDVETGLEGRYTAKKGGAFDGELTPDKRKDLIARASHLFETSNASDVDTRARSYADTDLDQELSDVYTHLVSDRSLSNSDVETFKFKKNPPNRSATRSTMLQEIRASRGEPAPTERTRYQQQNTSPAQANIEQANDLDKPTARGTRPKNATKADKELIEKLKDTITNTTQRGDKYSEARRLTVELQLAQSLKRYKDGHPTKGETATKESIYQIRRELRDRLKELTTGM